MNRGLAPDEPARDEFAGVSAPKSATHDRSLGEFAIGALVGVKLGTGRARLELDKEHGSGAFRAKRAVERRQRWLQLLTDAHGLLLVQAGALPGSQPPTPGTKPLSMMCPT